MQLSTLHAGSINEITLRVLLNILDKEMKSSLSGKFGTLPFEDEEDDSLWLLNNISDMDGSRTEDA